MRHWQNILGTAVLFGFYLLTAWVLTKWPMTLDRALILVALGGIAQIRWFQEDKSPLGEKDG